MDDDEQLRNLYVGLAMLGYLIRGHKESRIPEESILMADQILELLDKVKEEDLPYAGVSNRGLAAVGTKKKKD
mgnify:CR=1 FL=1